MNSKTLLAALFLSLSFSGCDRLSEKERMEMIAKCDAEARKKLEEKFELGEVGSVSVEVETHYSFDDRQCYALEKKILTLGSSYTKYTDTLYDGLTKKKLFETTCSSSEREGDNECNSGGGFSLGPLASEGIKNEKGLISYQDGLKIIEARMNRP